MDLSAEAERLSTVLWDPLLGETVVDKPCVCRRRACVGSFSSAELEAFKNACRAVLGAAVEVVGDFYPTPERVRECERYLVDLEDALHNLVDLYHRAEHRATLSQRGRLLNELCTAGQATQRTRRYVDKWVAEVNSVDLD